MVRSLTIRTPGPGLHEITAEIAAAIDGMIAGPSAEGDAAAGISSGLCTIFIRHTSASLTIQENADPSARRDLEAWLNRLVPPHDDLYTHTAEGPDDMPSHIKAALTNTSLGIPIIDGKLALGTWQGIYLWEHRSSPHRRSVIIHIGE